MNETAKHTPDTLELADELMAMAATIAAATSENGASVIREAAAQLRLFHFAAPAAPDMLAALKAMDDFWSEYHPDGPDGDPTTMGGLATFTDETLDVWRKIRAAISRAEGKS